MELASFILTHSNSYFLFILFSFWPRSVQPFTMLKPVKRQKKVAAPADDDGALERAEEAEAAASTAEEKDPNPEP